MSNLPRVSIVVLNAFGTDNLARCLDSVRETDYPDFEVIVVDCLTLGIERFVKESFSDIKLISLDVDIGPSAMHNVGIEAADSKSKYVAFLDNDTEVDRFWLRELVECLEKDERIGAVQSRLLMLGNSELLNSCGGVANYLAVGWPSGCGLPSARVEQEGDISFASGAAMAVRKEVLTNIGLFDEDYFIYADDLDVGLRIMIAGYRNVFCPRSMVYHDYRFLRSGRSYYYLTRNRLATFLKLYDRSTYMLLMPPLLVYECFVLGYALQNGYLRELLRAYGDTLGSITSIREKRSRVKETKVLSDREIMNRLDAGVRFNPILNPIVEFILNPILELYKRFILGVIPDG